jgi:hypothetical protein
MPQFRHLNPCSLEFLAHFRYFKEKQDALSEVETDTHGNTYKHTETLTHTDAHKHTGTQTHEHT